MRPTFMGFETATRGMMAQQKALDIVGNNVGNIGVNGYTRQRVDMVSMSLSNTNARLAQNQAGRAGQGVNVTGISQIRDPFLDKRFREEYADVGYYTTVNDILGDIESTLNEIEPSNMTVALSDFKNAWTKLQKEGNDPVIVNTVLAGARTITQIFKQMDTKLDSVWAQQKYDLDVNVNTVNTILSRIGDLNKSIKEEVFTNKANGSSGMPNEMLDARNVLLDQLSEFGDIQVTTNDDQTVTVKMGYDGHKIIDGEWSEQITMRHTEGTQVAGLQWQTQGANINLNTGSLKGALDMLNGRGVQAEAVRGENYEKGILYYKDKIDKFTETFADAFNSVVPIYDENGNETGTKQLFTFTGDGEKNAANITINKTWEDNPAYLTKDAQKPGSDGKDDTAFASRALALFSKELSFGEYKGTFDGYVSFYSVANLGNQITNTSNRLDSCASISDGILKRISAISGVSMEEEGVDMVQYTKAYNAMGRVMTALDEALDTLINRTGLVGR